MSNTRINFNNIYFRGICNSENFGLLTNEIIQKNLSGNHDSNIDYIDTLEQLKHKPPSDNRHYKRALFESDGVIIIQLASGTITTSLYGDTRVFNEDFYNEFTIQILLPNEQGILYDAIAFDYLTKLYSNLSKDDYYNVYYLGLYEKILRGETFTPVNHCYFKLNEHAIMPYKSRASDSGYDLSLIGLVEKVNNTFVFDTGVSIQPPFGYYFDLVPRSSLYKTGFILANSVGVIDHTYRGTIKVVLIKLDPHVPDFDLPFRAVQIIPRKIYHMEIVKADELEQTERNEKGFGSSGL